MASHFFMSRHFSLRWVTTTKLTTSRIFIIFKGNLKKATKCPFLVITCTRDLSSLLFSSRREELLALLPEARAELPLWSLDRRCVATVVAIHYRKTA